MSKRDESEALAELARELEIEARCRPFDIHRSVNPSSSSTIADVPVLHLDDVSAIPFLTGIAGVEQYQHRARVRAGTNDLFAASTEPPPGYETYCTRIGLGEPERIVTEPSARPLEVADACAKGEPLDRIAQRAERAGGLRIEPYMGIDAVWQLARIVAERAHVPITVTAPPPPVTWIANDKVLFSRVVQCVLGEEHLPEQRVVATVQDAADAAFDLAKRTSRIGFKRPRCASAMGNHVASAASLGSPALALEAAKNFAQETSWPEGESAIVCEWLDASSSPSTQLWIPPRGQPVRVDGVYEQILAGETQVFVGSRPSTLPERINKRLGAAASAVATALQTLGYVGRCSFDHLIVGDPEAEDAQVVFSECNGRWGGTSTPMHLVDRLVDGPRPAYRAQDVISKKLVGVPFEEVLAALESEIYTSNRAASDPGRLILYNVGPLLADGKLDVIAMGKSPAEADELMLDRLPRLLKI